MSPVEELRLAEYARRLTLLRRAVVATGDTPSVGRTLYERAARGGAAALGLEAGCIEAGVRADLVVLDPDAPSLLGAEGDGVLDALIFSGNVSPVRHVMAGGRWLVRERRHRHRERYLKGYRAALARLWT